MAQEVQAVMPEAVMRGRDGYLRVFYDKLGVKFQTYDRWIASGAQIPSHSRLVTDPALTRGCHDASLSFTHFRCALLARMASLALAAMLVVATASVASAQQIVQDARGGGRCAGERGQDRRHRKACLAVLGRDGVDIVSSGDEVADADTRQRFVAAYDAKHQITMEGDSKAVMIVGAGGFPFPIPLVRKSGTWRFDTVAGREEILYRRIGRNELDAIQACLAYVDAQNEYAEKDRTGAGVGAYAQRIVSQPGKKDGLYWPTAQGEEESPLGELVAQATGEGYRVGGARAPFHGYYYKILTKQGPAAPGGALDYVVQRQDDRRLRARRLSGRVWEFRRDDVHRQSRRARSSRKISGPRTAQLAERMTSFNPDQTWKKVDVTVTQP